MTTRKMCCSKFYVFRSLTLKKTELDNNCVYYFSLLISIAVDERCRSKLNGCNVTSEGPRQNTDPQWTGPLLTPLTLSKIHSKKIKKIFTFRTIFQYRTEYYYAYIMRISRVRNKKISHETFSSSVHIYLKLE